MSYILDALRRAEAERERGSVPGLHSPGLPASGATPVLPPPRRAPSPLLWLAGAAALALLGAALGAWWAGEAGQASAPQAVAAVDGRDTPGESARAEGATTTGAAVRVDPSAAGADAAPLQLPTPPAPLAPPPAAPPAVSPATNLPTSVSAAPAPGPDPVAALPASPAPRPAAPALAATPPPATAANGPVLPLAALSAEQRAAWPALAVGGSIYSDNPGSRFIIANGQVVREGETAAPGVTVERIGRAAVVLRWRGLRVEVPL